MSEPPATTTQRRRPFSQRLILPIIGGSMALSAVFFWKVWRAPIEYLGGVTFLYDVDVESRFDSRQSPDAAVQQTANVMRQRLEKLNSLGRVTSHGAQIEVQLPNIWFPRFSNDAVERMISRSARLEFKIVDDGSEYMHTLARAVASQPFTGIESGHDEWQEKDSGAQHSDDYLSGSNRKVLETFVAELAPEHQPPPDHEIGYEWRSTEDAEDAHWRIIIFIVVPS